jgi:hypothetical protein
MDLNITRTNPNQEWRKHLVLVFSPGKPLVGMVSDNCQIPFLLHNAVSYICNLAMVPAPGGKAQLTTNPRVLIFYDLFHAPVPELLVFKADHVIKISSLDKRDAEWFYEEYLNLVDGPSSILSAQINPSEAAKVFPVR